MIKCEKVQNEFSSYVKMFTSTKYVYLFEKKKWKIGRNYELLFFRRFITLLVRSFFLINFSRIYSYSRTCTMVLVKKNTVNAIINHDYFEFGSYGKLLLRHPKNIHMCDKHCIFENISRNLYKKKDNLWRL